MSETTIMTQAEAYARLQHVESELRGFIMRIMLARFGPEWEETRVPAVIGTKWRRRHYERDHKGYSWLKPVENVCELADFSDCKQMIQAHDNWCEVFQPIFRDSESIGKKLDEIYAIRNEITHMRPLSPGALQVLDEIATYILNIIHA